MTERKGKGGQAKGQGPKVLIAQLLRSNMVNWSWCVLVSYRGRCQVRVTQVTACKGASKGKQWGNKRQKRAE